MNIPSHESTRDLLIPLASQSDSLAHQQSLIAQALRILRAKKEEAISSYIIEVNNSIAHTQMSIQFDLIPSFEDGTPNGVLAKAFFYLIDDGFVMLNSECENFYHPELKFQHLIKFIAEAEPFIHAKDTVMKLDLPSIRKTSNESGKI